MRKSANKQQSQIHTIQRAVPSRNSGKAVTGFAVSAWGHFVICYHRNQENVC